MSGVRLIPGISFSSPVHFVVTFCFCWSNSIPVGPALTRLGSFRLELLPKQNNYTKDQNGPCDPFDEVGRTSKPFEVSLHRRPPANLRISLASGASFPSKLRITAASIASGCIRSRSNSCPARSANSVRKASCVRPLPSLKGWIAFSSAMKCAALPRKRPPIQASEMLLLP